MKTSLSSMAMTAPLALRDSAESGRESRQENGEGQARLFRSRAAGISLQRRVQPGAGVGPGAVRGAGGDAEGFGGLGDRQPREVAQLDDLRRRRIDGLESLQRLVDREDVQRRLRRLDLPVFDRVALEVAPL